MQTKEKFADPVKGYYQPYATGLVFLRPRSAMRATNRDAKEAQKLLLSGEAGDKLGVLGATRRTL